MTIRALAFSLLLAAAATADGERDNQQDNVRRIPPPGIAVPEADKAELSAGVAKLGKEIDALEADLQGKPGLTLLPDVRVYHKAVDWALRHNEIFNAKEIPLAKSVLEQGLSRAQQLREGKATWGTTSGVFALAYVSKIDGSVQPYKLVIPASWDGAQPTRHRLDTWFHGRGETLSELAFIGNKGAG